MVSQTSRSTVAIARTNNTHRELRLDGSLESGLADLMILRPFLHAERSCASYLFGCPSTGKLAVVDAHIDLVDAYLEAATGVGPIVAVFETHVQADHVSGLSALVEVTGATAYLPEGAPVEFEHQSLADGEVVELGNTVVTALATPGHAPAHHAYVVADRRRRLVGAARGADFQATTSRDPGSERRTLEDPWLVFTGDSLLVGDVGRPDLHASGEPGPLARELRASLDRLLALPDHVVVYPSHYGGSLCGRSLSGNPISTIGFERRHNPALAHDDADMFADALLHDLPPPPADHAAIVSANRRGAHPITA